MKKRQYLSPLAVSVAALLASAAVPAQASTDPAPVTVSAVASEAPAPVAVDHLVLTRSAGGGVQLAQHEFHASHELHSSHSSHVSGN